MITQLQNKVTCAFALAVFTALAACGPGSNPNEVRETITGGKIYPTYRYRLTVAIDTPEGVKTGLSVIEVSTARSGQYSLTKGSLAYDVRGEAVTVDLGVRGVIFALLRSEQLSGWASAGLELVVPPTPDSVKTDDRYGYRRAQALALNGPQVLPRNKGKNGELLYAASEPPNWYPMLVRFADIADPKTVAKVDPDDLAASFGKGVSLKRITLERTEDAVTTGIEKRLVWMRTLAGSLVKHPSLTPVAEIPTEHRINESDFQRGASK